jgi:DNA-binding CsgD family transcriptional regulator/tetratricopeptide (TPR) repeat protein
VLRGRETEQAAIDRLLERARSGTGGGLVLEGEPGIGKSALLAYADGRSAGMRVLRAAGVEAEAALPYATLHRLLLPVLNQMAQLPGPQSRALATALGMDEAEPPGRFLVSVAALLLLCETACGRPVLCLLDDLQWADIPSAEALMFIARRLGSEPIALLATVRVDGDPCVDTSGVPVLSLAGLDRDAAAGMLDARLGQRLHTAVRDELVRASGGNPLALTELPRALTSEHLAGREPLPEFLPLTAQLESVFLRRIRQGPPGTEGLLLLAAAAGSSTRGVVRHAARRLGADARLLESPALAHLVRVESAGISFRHPLVRSAVYRAASPEARQQAHMALAVALEGQQDAADRGAWHRAEAAEGPDEGVASALERSAERAMRRSGHAAAATALERAAQFSSGDAERARRLVAAADAAWQGGDGRRARTLLDQAERLGPRDAGVRLDLRYLRGLIELRAGVPADGLSMLLPAAREAAAADPRRAVRIVHATGEAAFLSADDVAQAEVGRLSLDLPAAEDRSQALLSRLMASARQARMGMRASLGDPALGQVLELDDPELLARAGGMTLGIGLQDLSQRLRARAVARARTLGAAGTLAWALEGVVTDEILLGRYASAEAHAEEGRRLALETGQVNSACAHLVSLALLAALRGREQETCRLADEALRVAAGRRLVRAAGGARIALGIMALAAGRPHEALEQFETLWQSWPNTSRRGPVLLVVPDLVEAAVRAGQPARCRDLMSALLVWAESSRSAEVHAVATRSRALLEAGEEAERAYVEALRLHAATERPLDHGRTALLYGEFLRRRRRRRDSRPPLRTALDTFEHLGTPVWAERARSELRATGETVQRRVSNAPVPLTGQEMQIVGAVGAGLTNREVAAQFFISPRTVDHHLRRVFSKLGISSRAELIRLAATNRLPASDTKGPDERQ